MALDRQKILNELGSVMNQLKSTDCGCMGKLFGDSGQNLTQTGNVSTCGGYRQSCCQGYHHGCSGSMSNNTQNFCRPCMGRCNPPKLYSDTYNYLNNNLMQPTINEVYNDLKDITPANTIMNNPMASQMGLSNQNQLAPPTMSSPQMEKYNVVGDFTAATNASNLNNLGQVGGMGPQIMNMIKENHASKPSYTAQQSKPVSLPSNQYNHNQNSPFLDQQQNTNQFVQQANQQPIEYFQQSSNITNAGLTHANHGQHAQGISKFKEMFPGVMKNDLGFDPMEIAIQMNPANQKQVALDTIHKMMNNNNNLGSIFKTNGNNGDIRSADNVSTNKNQYNAHPNQIQDNLLPNEVLETNVLNQQTNPQMLLQQQATTNTKLNNQPETSNQQVLLPSTNPYGAHLGQTNLNAYTALTNTPLVNQQQQSAYYQQPITDPNLSAQSNLPTVYEDISSSNTLHKVHEIPNAQQIIKEPILPADTSKFVMPKQKLFEYNTLGQPIEMLPAKMYHTPTPGLPQTLSPQATTKLKNDFARYSNVKSTISKTSLMGNKPIGKIPSRNQLQHLYNQYKGSQSFTHQNIKDEFNKDVSRSDGRINVPYVNLAAQQVPIENVGGDTAANNRLNDKRIYKMEHVTEQIGDAPIIKNSSNVPEKFSPAVNRKCRNGLQDMVYTSYPTSAAWSFHGHSRAVPYSAGYRYRNKI